MATKKKDPPADPPAEPVKLAKKAKSHEQRNAAARAKLDPDPDKRADQLRKGTTTGGRVRLT